MARGKCGGFATKTQLAFAQVRAYWRRRLLTLSISKLTVATLSRRAMRPTCQRHRNYLSESAAIVMAEEKKQKKTSVPEFVNQVRSETSKVVWPTREETIRTAIFVFIMMIVLSLFFLGVDSVFNAVVKFLLTLA